MTDKLSRRQRSKLMSKVRGRDTKPEWILRCALHRMGFRYRLGGKGLPGKPDLVFPKYRSVIFVHGCYWHRHPECRDASTPKTNRDFWVRKFAQNEKRDRDSIRDLGERGWRVLVVWECELLKSTRKTLDLVASWLRGLRRTADPEEYPSLTIQSKELLAVAERKIRYRIDNYEDRTS